MIIEIFDRPIAFHRCFVPLTGSITAALMLSQAIYWSNRTKNNDGWFYKTQEEWLDETGMSRSEQEKARDKLRCTGFWFEERRGVPAKLFFRVDEKELSAKVHGQKRIVVMEDVLKHSKRSLLGLSKTSLMRAIKIGVNSEYVDYSKVLEEHGMHCHICDQAITNTLGQQPDALCFDHVKPIVLGGAHVYENIKPAHFKCNGKKGGNFEEKDSNTNEIKNDYAKHTDKIQSAYTKQTGVLTVNTQECLPKADKKDYSKQTITENTSENTSEKVVVGKTENSYSESIEQNKALKKWLEYFMNVKGYALVEVQTVDTVPMFLEWEKIGVTDDDMVFAELAITKSLKGKRPVTPLYYRQIVQDIVEKRKSQNTARNGSGSNSNKTHNHGDNHERQGYNNETHSSTGRKQSAIERMAANSRELREIRAQESRVI